MKTGRAWAGRWVAVLLGAMALLARAAELPPRPADLLLPEDAEYAVAADGELSWLGIWTPKVWTAPPLGDCGPLKLGEVSWQPATGAVRQSPLEPALTLSDIVARAALPGGQLLWTVSGCDDRAAHERIVFLPRGARVPLTLTLPKGQPFAIRRPARWLALGPEAAALVARDEPGHLRVVTVRRQGDRLVLDALPASDLVMKGDFTAVVAGPDSLMILGGSNDSYRGCSACRAETLVLDLKRRAWRTGPRMLEARSEAGATTLPDGSVLVSGGWTQAAGWSDGPSATAERWDPALDRFEPLPPMPNGNARHSFLTWRAPWGDTLMSVMGVSGAAHAFDPATRSWRVLGDFASGSEGGGCGFFPFVLQGQAYAWNQRRGEAQGSAGECQGLSSLELSLLRPAAPAVSAPAPEAVLVTHRVEGSFLPAAGGAPALWLGGRQHAGMNNHRLSGAVEAVARDGRVSAWPSLQVGRAGAHVLRLAGGVLALGVPAPGQAKSSWRAPDSPPPAEWLAGPSARWQTVGGDVPAAGTALTTLPDGSLLALSADGTLRPLRLSSREGRPWLEAGSWPALNMPRRRGPNEEDDLGILALGDGRVVVAGGAVREEKIALLTPDTDKPDAPDDYVPIGPYVGQRCEVYDPKTRRWSVSEPAEHFGGRLLMVADGRVIKHGIVTVEEGSQAPFTRRREVFDPQTLRWSPFEPAGSQLVEDYRYRLFTLEGEILAAGHLAAPGAKAGNGGNGGIGLEWLNPVTRRWELLRQWPDATSAASGRVIVRSLAVGGGRHKTLVIPVEGF